MQLCSSKVDKLTGIVSSLSDYSSPLVSRGGYWKILSWTARNEGLSGLYRGFLPRLWFSVVGSALTLAGYEATKRFALKDLNAKEDL